VKAVFFRNSITNFWSRFLVSIENAIDAWSKDYLVFNVDGV